LAADGEFRRPPTRFREWVGGESGSPPAGVVAGRYHLYVSLACPWCHRTLIGRELAGLQEAIPVWYVAPFRDERGWAFTGERFEDGPGGEFVDGLNGWAFLSEAYTATDPGYRGGWTVPVLWDSRERRIVNNESSEIFRMMCTPGSLGGLGRVPVGEGCELDLRPAELCDEIDSINERVYDKVNNGVYRAGFARSQRAYERAFTDLFETLEWIEDSLSRRRYLIGERITEADWRLFPTLVRFDEVYNLHFRCNRRRVVDYQNLWGYARELYQLPRIARTVAMDQIKRHYYTTHDELNPKRIIPVGPGYDWAEPHGRG
jgi:glutathionyl-hydroquinone reductase